MVEDSEDTRALVKVILENRFEIECVETLAEANARLQEIKFDLILLDVMLPDGDGFHFLTQLKENPSFSEIPVILLTAKDQVSDRVLGFSLGAEDYIVKPFEKLEFRARVESKIARGSLAKAKPSQKGGIRLVPESMSAFLTDQGREDKLELTPIEFKLLNYFFIHENQVLARDQLIAAVWGPGVHILDRTVDKHIYGLRMKLGKKGQYIGSVHGVGYQFSQTEKGKSSRKILKQEPTQE